MADIWDELGGKIKTLIGNWTAVTALGSVALYLMGYLSLRFHLTVLGIGTDLSVLDERYIFEGVRFLVYLVSSVPTMALLLLVLSFFFYVPWRVLTAAVSRFPYDFRNNIKKFCSEPDRLALTGIILSVAIIQFIMRQALLFANLLLAERLPQPEWLQKILLAENEAYPQLFFCALLSGVMISAGFLFSAGSPKDKTAVSGFLTGVLGILLCVQLLFLPINYGILISSKTIPRVVYSISDKDSGTEGREAWLAWEGNEGVTFLVRNGQSPKQSRSLVTIPRKDVKRIEITSYDNIVRKLFLVERKKGDEEGKGSPEK